MVTKVALDEKFDLLTEHWRPKILGQANGQDVRIAKTQGIFPWHRHLHADEVFLCWRGRFRVEFRDRIVELSAGEMVVVPRGVEHRTASDDEAEILIFEPSDVINTGDALPSDYTAPQGATI